MHIKSNPMEISEKLRVLHLIKSKSYKSDGRLLKWIQSLKAYGIFSEVNILEDENKCETLQSNHVLINKGTLFFRAFFKKRKGYLLKIPEYSFKTIIQVLKSSHKICVFHDVQHYLSLVILLLIKRTHNKKIIWDLHELPHEQLGANIITRRIIQYILNRVDLIIYTNQQRRDIILRQYKFRETNHVILNNYPDESFICSPKQDLPFALDNWLDGNSYILWMGLGGKNRNFDTVIVTLAKLKDTLKEAGVKIVVMGNIESSILTLIDEYDLNELIYSKFISQDEVINYVDNALFSIVFYKASSLNNIYCEPNRLYQLLTRRIPVICGSNPPMKEVVEKYHGGIVLGDDGITHSELYQAISLMLQDSVRIKFREALFLQDFAKLLCWDEQFKEIVTQLEKLDDSRNLK